jgi:hypothetical protein
MNVSKGCVYDPETLTLLRAALDAAWDALPPEHHLRTTKSELAARLLHLAARGERDPDRLRAWTLMGALPSE